MDSEEIRRFKRFGMRAVASNLPDEYFEEDRLAPIIEQYLNLPIKDWPPFTINWDFSYSNQHMCYDSQTIYNPNNAPPMKILWVNLSELDSKMGPQGRRTNAEIWSIGSPRKVAEAIVYWLEGRLKTPPWNKSTQ